MSKLGNFIIFFILMVCLIFFYWTQLRKDKFLMSAFIDKESLIFNISEDGFRVFNYEISSLEEFNEDGESYKEIYKAEGLGHDINKIQVADFKGKKILTNHAYFLSFSRGGGKGEPGVVLKSFMFCIKQNKVLGEEKMDEKDFVNSCHK